MLLICFRSLDVCLDNDVERVHALRLIRKMLSVSPSLFPSSLVTVLLSVANDGVKERDKMVKTCLATICELGIVKTLSDRYQYLITINVEYSHYRQLQYS